MESPNYFACTLCNRQHLLGALVAARQDAEDNARCAAAGQPVSAGRCPDCGGACLYLPPQTTPPAQPIPLLQRDTNILKGMACPGCHSLGPFAISVVYTATVWDTEVEVQMVGEPTWNSDASCLCPACHFASDVQGFQCET